MNKYVAIIGILLIATVATLFLYLNQSTKQKETEAEVASLQSDFEQAQDEISRLKELTQEEREALEKAKTLAEKADEARRMAEQKLTEEERERERNIAELNQQLEQELRERKAAEMALQELEAKMEQLQAAQLDAMEKLTSLKEARQAKAAAATSKDALVAGSTQGATAVDSAATTTAAVTTATVLDEGEEAEPADVSMRDLEGLSDEELEVALAKLDATQDELDTLRSEHLRLKQEYEAALKRQIRTEEAIVRGGGFVEIPYPEIRSSNVKRRYFILFKERLRGQ